MRLSRPRLLLALVTVLVLAGAGIGAAVLVLHRPGPRHRPLPAARSAPAPSAPAASATGLSPFGVTADWVVRENRKPGSPSWVIGGAPAGGLIEGFADQVYAAEGQRVRLFVNTTAASFHVEAYRVGWYGGVGAREVWRSATVPGARQPACPVTPGSNLVSCANWAPSLAFTVTRDFPQGDYLLKLVGAGNEQSYVPLTVWDPSSSAAYLLKNDVYTWQAWNPYGGYDYYQGVGPCPANVYPLCSRARVVSYDRPYGDEQGTGDFLWLEAPLVRFVERHGLDVAYATDLTVVEHPEALGQHKALLSLGHDECWSLPERAAAQAAHDRGLNLAFFGASGVLRHVRSEASPLGRDRLVVDYRDSAADPLNGRGDPRRVTGNTWSAAPASWPESPFVGSAYNGFLLPGVRAGLTVSEAGSWIFAGTGLTSGAVLPDVIGSDVDSLEPPHEPVPPNVEVMAHSALPAVQATAGSRQGAVFYSDMTWWTDPAGHAGVWDSGTNNWIPALEPADGEDAATAGMVQRITGNLLAAIGQVPAGLQHPSMADAGQFYGYR